MWCRLAFPDRRGRLVSLILGVGVASAVWIVYVLGSATTPDEARESRSAPNLPTPTAKVVKQVIHQVTWYPCDQNTDVVAVAAPQVPLRQRSVVTSISKAGAAVTTGTKLGSVAGVPMFAVVTDGVFFRSLSLGDSGPDVQAFRMALMKAGFLARAGNKLDARVVAIWRDKVDPTSPTDRIRISTLIAVPRGGSVQAVMTSLGDRVKPGTVLMEVGAASDAFRCEVPDPSGEVTGSSVTLEVDGEDVAVDSLLVKPRTGQAPGSIEVVPAKDASGASVRLGMEATSSDGAVLTAPLSSIRTSPSGDTIVTVISEGDQRDVAVVLGVSAQGWVEVSGKGLAERDAVVLFDQATAAVGE